MDTVEIVEDDRIVALRRYAEARRAYEAMRDQTSDLKVAYEVAQQTLIDVLTNSGAKDTGKVPGVGEAVLMTPALKPQVLAQDRGRLAEWVKEIGHGDVIYPTLLPSALVEIVKARLDADQPIPDFIKIYMEPRIQFRKEN